MQIIEDILFIIHKYIKMAKNYIVQAVDSIYLQFVRIFIILN